MADLFEGQSVIDTQTGLPMTDERKAEIRAMLLAQGGAKIVVAPEAKAALEAGGHSVEEVESAIWAHLGGRKN